jgi:tRNA pseudouridine55 synthase
MAEGSKTHRRVVNGILLLDKPIGCTSNAALQKAKRMLNARKAGHTGSLDPLASGMLPLCFGEATKVSAFLLDADKTYRVTARLGQRTDTADADGQVIEEAPIPELDETSVQRVLDGFLGKSEQIPPMYSALKVQGTRLYKMARKGESIDRDARPIVIYELVLRGMQEGRITCDVRCSKGTYVRALVEDIAARLGTLAHVEALRRIAVGGFGGFAMYTLEQLEALSDAEMLDEALLPVDAALTDWPRIDLDRQSVEDLFLGRAVRASEAGASGRVRLYGPDGGIIGLGQVEESGLLVPRRMFPGLRGESEPSSAK